MKKQLMVGLLSAGLLAAMLPGVAWAETQECVGYNTLATFSQNIVVPEGEACHIVGDKTLTGNIEVEGGGAYLRLAGPQIKGNITVAPGSAMGLEGTDLYGQIECEAGNDLWLIGTANQVYGGWDGCRIRVWIP